MNQLSTESKGFLWTQRGNCRQLSHSISTWVLLCSNAKFPSLQTMPNHAEYLWDTSNYVNKLLIQWCVRSLEVTLRDTPKKYKVPHKKKPHQNISRLLHTTQNWKIRKTAAYIFLCPAKLSLLHTYIKTIDTDFTKRYDLKSGGMMMMI